MNGSRMEDMGIERMTAQDLEDVLPLEASSSLTPWSRAMFLAEMSNPRSHCFVLRRRDGSDPRVIGFICFRDLCGESELLELCVQPQFRRRGFGRKLMEFYLRACKESKVQRSYLEVSVANEPALHLYGSLSYRPAGRRPEFYPGKVDALIMIREI
jgi:ribosomal-protein-alanine N-acetyltransferase